MTKLDIQAQTTKTAQFIGTGVDVSGVTDNSGVADWTIVLEIIAMNAGNNASFVFEDSNNDFAAYNTDILTGPSVMVSGRIDSFSNPKRYVFKRSEFPSLRIGAASTKLRLVLQSITGSSKSVNYRSWIEY